jgi:transcriptional regulator GlxA family with amidase domain
MTRNVAILIFDDVEVLDFCGPFEVFGVAGEIGPDHPFNVYTIAEKRDPIRARNGLSVNPNYTITNCPDPDIILVPGGRGTRTQIYNTTLLEWLQQQYERIELLTSVCTGALVLARTGLLDGLSATTHYQSVEELRKLAPNTTIQPQERYVDNGKIILSAGISAGIDMSLYTVSRLCGPELADKTARHMQYDYWSPLSA